MSNQITSFAGENVFLTNEPVSAVHHKSLKSDIIRTLWFMGPVKDSSGHASRALRKNILFLLGKDYHPNQIINAVSGLKNCDGMIASETVSRRTYSISLEGVNIPKRWYEKILGPNADHPQEIVSFLSGDDPDNDDNDETVEPEEAAIVEEVVVEEAATVLASEPINSSVSGFLDMTVKDLLDIIKDAIGPVNTPVAETVNAPFPTPSESEEKLREQLAQAVNQIESLKARNTRLETQLNRVSGQIRTNDNAPRPKAIDKSKVKATTFNPSSLGIKDSMTIKLLKHAAQHGFEISKTSGNHIKIQPPNPEAKLIYTSSTPSDHRTYQNLKSDLYQAGLPRMEM